MILSEKKVKNQFSTKNWESGTAYYNKKKVKIHKVDRGYIESSEEPVYKVFATIKGHGQKEYNVDFLACEGEIHNINCSCSSYSYYYDYWENRNGCAHAAAAALEFIDYESTYPIEITTSKSVATIINAYTDQFMANVLSNHITEKVDIVPKLEVDGEYLQVSFKVGGRKKYVIKNLQEFNSNMKEGVEFQYGKDLKLIHHMNSFTEPSQSYVRFIMSRTEESQLYINQYGGDSFGGKGYSRYFARNHIKVPDKRSIILSPLSLDQLFPLIEGQDIEYSRKNSQNDTVITKVNCIHDNPKLTLNIKPLNTGKSGKSQGELTGIVVNLENVECYAGERYLYVRKGDTLFQTDENYKKAMEPILTKITRLPTKDMKIGKESLGVFYRDVLGRIKDYIEIVEENPAEIERFLPPDPEFVFYLDYVNRKNILCKVGIKYGEKEFHPYIQNQEEDYVRDFTKEFEIMLCVKKYLPYYDEKLQLNHCNNDVDIIYSFLETGLDELMSLGEVKVTDELKRLQIQSSPRVTVGVSVESDLLNLELSTQDLDFNELAEVLDSYRLRKKYHRLKNGNFLKLEENSLSTLTELVDGLHLSVKDLTKGKMHIPAYRALYLDKVLQESEDVSYERDQYFKQLLRNFKSVEDSDYKVPGELKPILRNYQKNGYRWLRTIEGYSFGGILADDMGLGKTLQVITMLLASKQEGKKGTSIVVCPASLVFNWDNEIKQFAPSLNVKTITGTAQERKEAIANIDNEDVVITSYDLLKRDIEHYEEHTFLYEIIDEAQYIKNHTTQSSKAVKLIHAKTRFALTGTPIENRLSELWSIFDYLMPGFLYNYERFKKDLETPIAKDNDEIAVGRLKKMITPFILRRLKKDVLKDLPDKIEQVTYSKLEGEQQKLYDAYVAKVKQNLSSQSHEDFEKNKIKILAELTRMRQICCDPSLCYENYHGDSAKLNSCMDLISSAIEGGHKILLFSQFTSMLAIIANKLKDENIAYYELTGETSKKKRMQLVEAFNKDETPIFLISLKAGGTGLNLTGADIIIHYDPWWNVAAQNQATDRAHRIGQKNIVTVFKLIAKSTIEEKILKLQEAKKDLADTIINGETSRLTSMTKEDFMELL